MTAESLGLLFTLIFGFSALLYVLRKAKKQRNSDNLLQFRTYHRLEWLRKRRMARLAAAMKKGKKL